MTGFDALLQLPEPCRDSVIRMGCARIQAGWTEVEKERRCVHKPSSVIANLLERSTSMRRVDRRQEVVAV